MELLITTGLVGAAVFMLIVLVMEQGAKKRLVFEERLKAYSLQEKMENAIQEELSVPLSERLTRPLRRVVRALPERAMPAITLEGLSTKLMLAGYPGNLTAAEFVALRYSLMLLIPGIVFVLILFSGYSLLHAGMLIFFSGFLGYFIPDLFLKIKRTSRQEEIRRQLPDVLDLLTVSVEAGLGFDAAVSKVVEKMDGALPRELGRLLQEIKMGKPRRESLKDLRDRIAVEDVSNFISAVLQADHLGVGIGNVLRLQASDSREKRRQEAQEKAQKAPVKMVLPLVLFIFPAIFIVLLGPALLNIIDTFSKM
ncbi:MAG: type II secretion system F family protein [Bacillota bacterium]